MKRKIPSSTRVPKPSPVPRETLEISNRCELLLCGVLLLRGFLECIRFENRPPKKGGYRSCH